AQPFVRASVTSAAAEWFRQMHPLRLQYELLSDANPFMRWVGSAAQKVKENRRPVASGNALLAMPEDISRQTVKVLDSWRDTLQKRSEHSLLPISGSPLVHAAVGIDPSGEQPFRRAPRDPLHMQLVHQRVSEIKAKIAEGGVREANIRAVLYVGMTR